MRHPHPLVIIGAGPIGLAAAANAAERGMDFVVLEAGPHAAAAVGEWAHVRLFSAWRELVDPAARRLLERVRHLDGARRRRLPDRGRVAYGVPGAACRAAGRHRRGIRRVRHPRGRRRSLRSRPPGRLRARGRPVRRARRGPHRPRATARRRCRGRLRHVDPPQPAGRRRLPRPRRDRARRAHHLRHPRPQRPRRRQRGSPASTSPSPARAPPPRGSSSGLAALARSNPDTRISWLLRRPSVGDAFGGGDNDQLEQRGKLGQDARSAAGSGLVTHVTRFRTESVSAAGRRAPHAHLGRRPAGGRRRRGRRGHRVPARLQLPLRGPPRPRPGTRLDPHPGRPDPPGPPQLRRRRPPRPPRARPARARASTSSG